MREDRSTLTRIRRGPRRLLALCLCGAIAAGPAGLALAADVPVVGIATGDASREPVVDYLRMMSRFEYELSGFEIIPPDETSRRLEALAAAGRPQRGSDDRLDLIHDMVREGWALLERRDYIEGRERLETAVSMLEYGDPTRIPRGQQALWYLARMLLASAYLQDFRDEGGDRESARAALVPLAPYFPDRDPAAEGYSRRMVALYDEVRRDLYLRPRGALTVRSFGVSHDVYVNGVLVGRSPIERLVLPVGVYEVEVGRVSSPSRVHKVEVGRGAHAELEIDPLFEQSLTTRGFPIYEAPSGADPRALSTQVGRSAGRALGARYALVLAAPAEGEIYAAMVDVDSGTVVSEYTHEIPDGMDRDDALADTLEFVIDRREPRREASDEASDEGSDQLLLWAIVSSVAAAGLAVLGFYMLSEGADLDAQASEQIVGSQRGDELSDEANQRFAWGGVSLGAAALLTIVAVYLFYLDAQPRPDSRYDGLGEAGDWDLLAVPLVSPRGVTGFSLGVQVHF